MDQRQFDRQRPGQWDFGVVAADPQIRSQAAEHDDAGNQQKGAYIAIVDLAPEANRHDENKREAEISPLFRDIRGEVAGGAGEDRARKPGHIGGN